MGIEAINLSYTDSAISKLWKEIERLKAKINEPSYIDESERYRNKVLTDELSRVLERNSELITKLAATQAKLDQLRATFQNVFGVEIPERMWG